ncbi:GspMb/PilO family protein [Aestuariibius sp. 2305UL40-4]|uniref:GspMb/PilO family protein n=1 Tax=Aestuariibius violaceus TaxID=3234132 RepID=UPI00345E2646
MSQIVFADRDKPARIGRVLEYVAFGIALVFVLLAWRAVEARSSSLAELRAVTERAEAVEARVATSDGAFAAALYAAGTPREAQTRLQTDAQALAAAHGLEIEVIRAREVTPDGPLLTIGMVLAGAIPEDRLEDFLYAVADAEPLIAATEIELRRARTLSRSDPTRRIAIQMTLEAYLQP